LLAATPAVALTPALTRTPPPEATPKPVTETFFGTPIVDPYRYLEDVKNPAVAAWMQSQADYARAALDAIPGRAPLLARIKRFADAAPAHLNDVRRRPNDLYFYLKRATGDDQYKLCFRRGMVSGEKILVDPQALAKASSKPHAINWFEPSASGRYVAYGMSAGGAEDADLYVVDSATGKRLLGPVTRADYGGVSWVGDDSGFFFTRLQPLTADMTAVDKFQKPRALFVRLGRDVDDAPSVLAFDSPGVTMSPVDDVPVVYPLPETSYVAGVIAHGTDREIAFYVAPTVEAIAGHAQWRKLVDPGDEITAVDSAGDRLFALSHKDATRFRVLETSLTHPDWAHARVLIEQGAGVLTGLARAADGLFVTRRDGAVSHLLRVDLKTGGISEISVPLAGSIELNGIDYRLPGALLTLQSWTRAAQIYRVAGSSVINTRLQPRGRFDEMPDFVSTEVLVKSHDGALVPLSIIHKRGVKLDGSNPTILYGYASYGFTEEPFFSPSRLAWLERGGVFAVANPRGSGAFGQDWYKAGFQASKPNSWLDFIACAEYLVAQRYTSSAKLAIWGGSAGGILIGRAMTERPDLFAVAISAVGVLDTLRAEFTANGIQNISEFGSVKSESGFRALVAMSTYHQIKDGVKYPAVLFTAGVNDPRVDVWHSTKTAARLRAASSSGKPVLLRLDYDSGHGIGDTQTQTEQERADVFAFALWQFGVPEFRSP